MEEQLSVPLLDCSWRWTRRTHCPSCFSFSQTRASSSRSLQQTSESQSLVSASCLSTTFALADCDTSLLPLAVPLRVSRSTLPPKWPVSSTLTSRLSPSERTHGPSTRASSLFALSAHRTSRSLHCVLVWRHSHDLHLITSSPLLQICRAGPGRADSWGWSRRGRDARAGSGVGDGRAQVCGEQDLRTE